MMKLYRIRKMSASKKISLSTTWHPNYFARCIIRMLHLFSYAKRLNSRGCKARFQIRKQILSYVRVFRLIQTSFQRSRAELDFPLPRHNKTL